MTSLLPLAPGLLALAGFAWTSRRLAARWYLLAAAALSIVNLVSHGAGATSAAAGAAVLLLVVFVLTGLLPRSTAFSVVTVAVGWPLVWWWLLLPGLLTATAVAAARLRRTAGKGYVGMVLGETLMTFAPAATLSRPTLDRLPLPDADANTDTPVSRAHQQRMPLLRYLAAGAASAWLVLVVATVAGVSQFGG